MIHSSDEWDRLADALEYPHDAPPNVQERYVEAFDLDPESTLDIGWHLFADRPERGQFLVMVRQRLERAGISERTELPDHLPTLLRLIARQPDDQARDLAELIAPAVEHVVDHLRAGNNPFGDTIDAVARALDARRRREDQS
jgi:nitrate reductase assembly molybdenum cofactor insertion protein NarJ